MSFKILFINSFWYRLTRFLEKYQMLFKMVSLMSKVVFLSLFPCNDR